MAVIDVKNVHKIYKESVVEVYAVRGVDLKIDEAVLEYESKELAAESIEGILELAN